MKKEIDIIFETKQNFWKLKKIIIEGFTKYSWNFNKRLDQVEEFQTWKTGLLIDQVNQK